MKKIILFLSLVLSTCIAEAQWGPLGSGLNGRVRALTVFNGEIYAGGKFTNNVAKWNAGTNLWETAGNGLNDSVNALAVHAGKLYAGGGFSANGTGTSVKNISVLNTTTNTWDPIGSGLNNFVRTLFSDGIDLYIGGAFNNSGTPAVSRIAKLNGSTFAQVGSNPLNVVYSIAKFNGTIYIGGAFSPSYLKRLDIASNTWQELSGLNNTVNALYPYGGYLYIGGEFTSPTQKIARTSNTSIISTINNLNASVHALYATPTKLFGGGAFTQSPSSTATLPHFFSQNGNNPFFAEGSNFNGDILAIANFNGKIVVGGSFSASGSTSLNNVSISSQTIDVEEISSLISDKIFYPNPMRSNANLRIETNQSISNPKLKIIDAGSRLIRTISADPISGNNTLMFNISGEGLASGNYFYVLEDENGNALLSDIFMVE